MKKTKKISLSGILLLWFILLTPSVLGVAEQFFPEEGTTIEYKLKFVFNWSNGTTEETIRFEVWNSSIAPYIVPMPMLLKEPGLFTGFNVLESEVEITLTRTYSSLSATQFNRTSELKGNTTSFDQNEVYIGIMMGKSAVNGVASMFMLNSREIDKLNYWDGASGDFVDYFDKNTAFGEYADFQHTILAITDDSMIALDVNGISFQNSTYVADRNGQVYFFQQARISPYPAMDADSVAFVWYRVRETSVTIPSYNIGIILTVMVSIVAIYGIKIKKSKNSSN